ncbi:hypothetical protein DFQ08_104329 [Winogradskyella arenosi]|uniref:Uncharacterized protein n=1 Tax=Winogradskyella arenosi TaxID=533325 RepID=A0A368ZEV7_9FLAO|nr:hypothetical protein DFQ08_104329 [Winogradskyella arenosi]
MRTGVGHCVCNENGIQERGDRTLRLIGEKLSGDATNKKPYHSEICVDMAFIEVVLT